MKTSYSVLFGAALLAVVAFTSFTSFTPKATAQPQRTQSAAVVFGAHLIYDGSGSPQGYGIYVVSQGPSAPEVKVGSDLAPTIEMLLANGFDVVTMPGFQFMATRR